MLIYGAGGHAKVIIDTALTIGKQVNGVFDDYSMEPVLGIQNLGTYNESKYISDKIIVGIGDNKVRMNIVSQIIKHPIGTLIHTGSSISDYSSIGDGTVLFNLSVVQTDSHIAEHVIINTGVQIDHDCEIADYCHIGPGAVICGGVKIGVGTFVGAGATVVPGITIGKWSVIGAGAVVVNDVADFSKMIGVPAKPMRCK